MGRQSERKSAFGHIPVTDYVWPLLGLLALVGVLALLARALMRDIIAGSAWRL